MDSSIDIAVDVGSLRSSARAFKAAFSRAYNAAEKHLSYDVSSYMVTKVSELANQAEVQFRKLETANTALATAIPSESEDIYAALDAENERLLSLLEKVATFMSDTEVSFAAASTDGTSSPRPASSRLVEDSLKPFTLSRDHTPQDLRTWIGQVEQYLRIGTIRTQPLDTQRAFLDRCIDSALLRDLRQFIAPDTAISSPDGCLEIIQARFRRMYPISIAAWSSSGPSQPPARMPPPSSAALWTRPPRPTSSLSLETN